MCAGSLSLSQTSGFWGTRNNLLASSLYYPMIVPACLPESTLWMGSRDENSASFPSPLNLLKKPGIKKPPSDGSPEGWSRVLSPF